MKKPILSFKTAYLWNKLVRKFYNAFRRFKTLKSSSDASLVELNFLQLKLQKLFNRLSKLQSKTGIKLAGTAIALMLISTNLNAQVYVNEGPISSPLSTDINIRFFSSPTAADLDDDGDDDLIVSNYSGGISVFLNEGASGFVNNGSLNADGIPINIGDFPKTAVADLDNDSDLDLYIGDYYGNIKVFINDGTGIFSSAADLQADGINIDVGVFATPFFADIDGDSDLDLYIGEYNGSIKVFINSGSGVFTAAGNMQANSVDIALGVLPQPTFYDLDGDSDLDLFVGDVSGKIKVFSNNGTGVFSAQPDLQSSGVDIQFSNFSSPAFLDMDNDGDADLLIGEYFGFVQVFTNNGSGILSDSTNLQARGNYFDFGDFSAPAFADIDEDGDLDMYIGTRFGKIAILRNNGSGIFSQRPYMMVSGSQIDVGNYAIPEFADLDEDGDMDLFIGNHSGNIIQYLNDGSGVFSSGVNLQADALDINVGSLASPTFADIDNDGDLDLYVGSYYGTILEFENDGTGTLSAAGVFQADGGILTVPNNSFPDFNDLDGDGDLDLLVGDYYGMISVFINNSGVFNASLSYFQADGTDLNAGLIAIPKMVNLDGGCGPDLFVGGSHPITFYSYKDTLAPSITCPSNVTYNLLQYQSNYTVPGNTLNPVSFSDNCQVESVLNDFNASSTLAGINFSAGTYTILWTITDIDGNTNQCSVDLDVNVFNSIDDLADMGISVYPNPSSGIFTIENAENCDISLSDAFGKEVYKSSKNESPKFEINLSGFPSGIYFLTIMNGEDVKTVKLIKE
jgi:hypothetical protein